MNHSKNNINEMNDPILYLANKKRKANQMRKVLEKGS